MAMSEAAQREYDAALREAVLRRGTPIRLDASCYGWGEHRLTGHASRCKLITGEKPYEDTWDEFMGTFYKGDTSVHGVSVDGVSCECGEIKDRTFRWQASTSEMIEAVFEIAFVRKNS